MALTKWKQQPDKGGTFRTSNFGYSYNIANWKKGNRFIRVIRSGEDDDWKVEIGVTKKGKYGIEDKVTKTFQGYPIGYRSKKEAIKVAKEYMKK